MLNAANMMYFIPQTVKSLLHANVKQ